MQANFNLTILELYGVHTHQGSQDESSESNSSDGSVILHGAATRFGAALQWVLTRNRNLQGNTRTAAFQLLRYSRTLLLKPRRTNEDEARVSSPHIQSLPTELQLHILSLTVDTLSANQRIRIFRFASDLSTLPTILPDLRRRQPEGVPELGLLEKSSAPFTSSPRDITRTQWLQTMGCDLYEP